MCIEDRLPMFSMASLNVRNLFWAAFGMFVLPLAGLRYAAAATTTTTTLAITSSAGAVSSVPAGTSVTLTATVKAGSALVSGGWVKFCDAAAAHCTDIHLEGLGQLTSTGVAAFKFVPGPGAHSYKAAFTGKTTEAASTSAAVSLTVSGAPTTTTIAKSGATGDYTLKATVSGKGSRTGPTGKVSFLDSSNKNAVLGTATLGTSTDIFSWTTPASAATAAEPRSIVSADINGDGIPDLAIGANGTAATKNIGSIDILLGTGAGTFQTAKSYAGLSGDQLIIAAPFVTGGPMDILAVSSSATTNNGLLFLGNGTGGLNTGTKLSLGLDTVTALIAGDFNGDGKVDFVVGGTAFGVPVFNVFLGNGNGTFDSGTLNATSDVPITALGAGDFTGQGALDIAVVHSDGTVDVFLQDGVGDFYPNAGTTAGSSPTAIAIGDFNGDGKADLAITNSAQDNVSVLLGNGSGDFKAIASPGTGSVPKAIAVGDFNADGLPDLAIANSSAGTVTILLGKGDGTFTVEPALDTGSTPTSLAVARFNSEDTGDIAVANKNPASSASAGTATILLSQLAQSATASVTGIAPAGAGTQLVDASYGGDATWQASVSATTSLNGSGKQAAAPAFSPAAGSYSAAQTVTLTDTTPGAIIYYTINGSAPTTGSLKYKAPFKVAKSETVEAIAVASGYRTSAVASAAYTIRSGTEVTATLTRRHVGSYQRAAADRMILAKAG